MAFTAGADDATEFPYLCPAGVVGGSSGTEQSSPLCKQPCPAGSFCSAATTEPVACPLGYFCPLGTPAAIVCPSGTYAMSDGLSRADQCQPCQTGHWCYSGASNPCPKDTYNSYARKDNQGACLPCPENSHTDAAASSKLAACKCKASYFMDENERQEKVCKSCPLPGSNCTEAGLYRESIPLADGYWRLDYTSLEIRPCKDHASGNSACGAGVAICKPERNISGVFCRKCDEENVYFSDSVCKACEPLLDTWAVVLGLLVVIVLGLLVAATLLFRRYRKAQQFEAGGKVDKHKANFQAFLRALERFHVVNKLKLVWSCYQIVGKTGTVYQAQTPEDVKRLMDLVTIGISLGLDDVGSLLKCIDGNLASKENG